MQKINNKKLEKITGGEVSVWVYLIATSIIIFLSGVIKGYTHRIKKTLDRYFFLKFFLLYFRNINFKN